MQWLVASIVLSVVLTVVLNVGLRLFPPRERPVRRMEPGVRVIVPWKAMLVASLVLTVVLNLFLWSR